MSDHHAVIIGAGPAGLTAAYELGKRHIPVSVFERSGLVGGIARTETYQGYRFDIGGHRFFTKVAEVAELWHELMGDDFQKVPRLSRIYYGGRFYRYPLDMLNTLKNLGLVESARILLSYCRARIRPSPVEDTFEQWVTNRFGVRLFRTFFQTYTEKVWGIPCNQIQADWAAQRIKGLSLTVAVRNALFGSNTTATLIEEFNYPPLGPGMMWERFHQAVERMGGRVQLNSGIGRLRHDNRCITSATVQTDSGPIDVEGTHFISSMPITELIAQLDPPPSPEVLEAAHNLHYRAFIQVGLILSRPDSFPDNWLYIHTPNVKVGRIQNFKNWSAAMVPDARKTSLGMEYFCDEGDSLWSCSDAELIALASRELVALGIASANEIEDGVVLRQPKAYPVYDRDYRTHLDVIREYLATFTNLQTIGRNGMHRYNNQDHSMLTGLLAARNVLGERHDLWNVNTERSYYEDFATEPRGKVTHASTQTRRHRLRPCCPDGAHQPSDPAA